MALSLAILVLVSISLLALVVYAGAFALIALRTVRQRNRPDPLAEELDQFLDEVLHTGVPQRRGAA